ncbi:hypothetical protein PMI06_006615 [Burkholderia sp. BT03]|nr:hypothetical protein PMI06_006615 [Burkholderia sp. BT03]SKC93898.1 hypothetical protein SAMN06266956_5811 [Paraburkholderia hospita]
MSIRCWLSIAKRPSVRLSRRPVARSWSAATRSGTCRNVASRRSFSHRRGLPARLSTLTAGSVDVTEAVLRLDLDRIRGLQDGGESSADLVDVKVKRGHQGPFTVSVSYSVLKFFGVESLRDITEEHLLQVRDDRKLRQNSLSERLAAQPTPTVLDVALAMERTGGLTARPWASVEHQRSNDPQTNGALDAGVAAGYLVRLSGTALHWNEAGVAARDAARATAALQVPGRPVRGRMFAWINDEHGYLPMQVIRDVSNERTNTTPRLAGERVFEVCHVTGSYRGQYPVIAERHLFDAVPADEAEHQQQIRRYELAALYTELDSIHDRVSGKARYGLSRDDDAGPYLSTNEEVSRYRTLKTSIDAALRAAQPGAPVTADDVAAAYAAARRGIRAEYVGGGRIRVTNHNTPSLAVRYLTVPQARAAIDARSTNGVTPTPAPVAKRDAVAPACEASPSPDL